MEQPALDPGILVAAAGGDVSARDRFVSGWLPHVLRWCARLGGPRVDPEDAAHEVFLVVLRRLPELASVRAPGPWLYQVTRKVLAQHRRRVWFSRWVGAFGMDEIAAEPATAGWVRSDLARRVQQALEELPADQREVLVLCDMEQFTDQEVATLVGVPVGTVKSRLRIGRDRFRRAATRLGLSPELRVAEGGA